MSTKKKNFCSKLQYFTNLSIESEHSKNLVDRELESMKFGGLELIIENSHEESQLSFSGDFSLSIATHDGPSFSTPHKTALILQETKSQKNNFLKKKNKTVVENINIYADMDEPKCQKKLKKISQKVDYQNHQ